MVRLERLLLNKLHFFADSGTDAPSKLVLERYVGPEFEVPTYYLLKPTTQTIHSTIQKLGSCSHRADKDIEAGD